MLGKVSLTLETDEAISFQKSSLFHGVLMERLEPAYAAILHENGLKPFSQNIMMSGGKTIWTINALNAEACEKIFKALSDTMGTEILLTHNNISLRISEKKKYRTSYQDLVNTWYFGEHSRLVNIRFHTPTAFKSAEQYVFYPDIGLIIKSLISKYDAFSTSGSIWTDEVYEQLLGNIQIRSYKLRSISFHLESSWIPAFMGSIGIYIHGPQPLVNLVHLLLRFGEYSGVGIKTSLGMGAIEVTERRTRSD